MVLRPKENLYLISSNLFTLRTILPILKYPLYPGLRFEF